MAGPFSTLRSTPKRDKMEINCENSKPKTFRDLGAEARVEELHSLQHVLERPDPITHAQLSDWVSASDNRRALLAGSVWGGIHWPKSLGKPKTASITGGFSIVHEFKRIEYIDQGEGHIIDISKFKLQPAPSVWDASSGSEYRVAFFFFAGGGGINPNRLTVTFASVSWELSLLVGPGYLRLDPYGYSDFGNLGERVVFPDYEVKHQPYSRGRSIQTLGSARDSELFKQPNT
jgi:hypothetical protein